MPHASKQPTKHDYNKPRLKEQIDAALSAYLQAGRSVEKLPAVVMAEPVAIVSERRVEDEES